MRNRVPGFLLALALAGTLGLAGCGGDDDGDDTSGPSDESTSAATESEPAEEPEATEEAPEATEATSEPAEEPEEGDGDKPSREEVIEGYKGIITAGQSGLPDDIVTTTATCFTDELYDVASAETLQAIADENAGGINPDDASLFGDAATACASAG